MCIIVDPPLFIPIFKETDEDHEVYAPILSWIQTHKTGKFVLGGTLYLSELSRVSSIIPLLRELEKRGKIIRAPNNNVDIEEKFVKDIEPSTDFDDPHLVALVRVTGCRLICVRDPRSHRFLRSTRFYKSSKDRPRLYTRLKNHNILCNSNIANCCK